MPWIGPDRRSLLERVRRAGVLRTTFFLAGAVFLPAFLLAAFFFGAAFFLLAFLATFFFEIFFRAGFFLLAFLATFFLATFFLAAFFLATFFFETFSGAPAGSRKGRDYTLMAALWKPFLRGFRAVSRRAPRIVLLGEFLYTSRI
jgi:hypothetical protein